jgi:hypothetical protein
MRLVSAAGNGNHAALRGVVNVYTWEAGKQELTVGKMLDAALVGKAGEALVAAELLRRHVDVAYPAFDGGVDLIAYRGHAFDKVVPIQVKTRSKTCFEFYKSWFGIKRLVLVQVWYAVDKPRFFIFGNVEEAEQALGDHAKTASWMEKGAYTVTQSNEQHIARMLPYENKWEKITTLLTQ